MRSRLIVAVAAAALGAALVPQVGGSEARRETRADPARLLVMADEFRFVLSRGALKAGPAVVQLVNNGEDEHDLALRRTGGRRFRIATVEPGRVGELEATLVPGRYRLWCTLADHRARGMSAMLIVRR